MPGPYPQVLPLAPAPLRPPTTYYWNSATSASSTYTASAAGTYSVVAQSTAGCNSDATTGSILVATTPTVNATITSTANALCGSNTVTLTAAPTSTPSAGYDYFWSADGGATFSTSAGSNTLVVSSAGNYVVKIIDNATGCYGESTPVAVNTGTGPSVNITGANSFCQGSNTTLSVTSTPGYSYQWSVPAGVTASTTNDQIATAAGNYNVTVTNTANGCSATQATAKVLTIDAKPSAPSVSGNTSICASGAGTTSTTLTASGSGTGATYYWNSATSASSTSSHKAPQGVTPMPLPDPSWSLQRPW